MERPLDQYRSFPRTTCKGAVCAEHITSTLPITTTHLFGLLLLRVESKAAALPCRLERGQAGAGMHGGWWKILRDGAVALLDLCCEMREQRQ